MTVVTAPAARHRRTKRSLWPWILLALAILSVSGFVAAKMAINGYLRSDRFRQFVSGKMGETLHAQVEAMPFQFAGGTIYLDGMEAHGTTSAAFSNLQLEHVRVDLSTRRFFEHVWQIDQIDIQRARLNLDGPRPAAEITALVPERPVDLAQGSSWWPNRVEIGTTTIHDVDLQWLGGLATGATVKVTQQDGGGWVITAHGGSVKQSNMATLDIESVKMLYRAPFLFVQSADFQESGGGTLKASGEIQFDDHVDLLAELDRIPVNPLLQPDWRGKLTGNLNGEVRIKTALPMKDGPTLKGSLNLTDGRLEALSVLDDIAKFTDTVRFRQLNLTNASGDFDRDAKRLAVTNFIMESKGLIRIEGAFTIENEMIDGSFQVGITPASLQSLPGSQERVFTVARAGYLWAPMRLTGPVSKPNEDLSGRLKAAALGAVFDAAAGAVRGILDKAPEVQKNAADAADQLQKAADQGLKLLLVN
jgi:hypothetical protein